MISIPLERHSIRWSTISLATFCFSAREWLMTTNSTSVGDGIARGHEGLEVGVVAGDHDGHAGTGGVGGIRPREDVGPARGHGGLDGVEGVGLRRRERCRTTGSCRGQAAADGDEVDARGAALPVRVSGPRAPLSGAGAPGRVLHDLGRRARAGAARRRAVVAEPPRCRRRPRRRRRRLRRRAAVDRRREVRARPRMRARWAKRSSRGGSRSFMVDSAFRSCSSPSSGAAPGPRVVSSLMERLLPRSVVVRPAGRAGRRARARSGS